MTADEPTPEERDPLDRIAEEYSEALRSGRPVSSSDFLERYPDHRGELEELLPTVELIESLKARRVTARTTGELPRPEQLGDFRILREIGRGGMGIVYEATQISLGRRVALKVLPQPLQHDSSRRLRFEQEARVAAGLHHTNIVPVFGVGEEQGLQYYAMQFIDGLGLDEILKDLRLRQGDRNGGRLDRRQHLFRSVRKPAGRPYFELVARIGLQVSRALQHAHQQGALHRDIKPANLILDRRGRVWVADFGVARLTDQPGLTRTGDLVGTPQYLAPEGLRGEWDERTDIYGLGVTLYELSTWALPFGEDSAAGLLEKLRSGTLALPRRTNPQMPVDLETVVLKAAAADPRHRYLDAGELAEDLRRFLEDRPVLARRVGPLDRLSRWCRRNRTVAALSVTAAASLLLAAVLGWIGYAGTRQALERESNRRDEAEAATRRANANVDLSLSALQSIFDHLAPEDPLERRRWEARAGSNPRPPPEPSNRGEDLELIQSILEFYEEFAAENSTGAGLQLEAARAYNRVAEIQRRLDRETESAAAFERSHELLEHLRSASPEDPELLHLLADTTLRLDPTRVDADLLITRLNRTRTDVEWLMTNDPGPRNSDLKSRFDLRYGWVLEQSGQLPAAEQCYRRAIAFLEPKTRIRPHDLNARADLATSRSALAGLLLDQARDKEALELLEAAVADFPFAAPPGPEGRRQSQVLADLYRALADVYDKLGDQGAARQATRDSESHEALATSNQRPPLRPGPERTGRRR